MSALGWLAGSAVAQAFGGLRAGQVVMLGSVCTTVWVDAPCDVTVTFAGLPEVKLRLA
jgi:2-keto-4-pentenoate hydratase